MTLTGVAAVGAAIAAAAFKPQTAERMWDWLAAVVALITVAVFVSFLLPRRERNLDSTI